MYNVASAIGVGSYILVYTVHEYVYKPDYSG